MPWCEDCAKFWNPSSMRPGGECPTCGRVIATVGSGASPDQASEPSEASAALGEVEGEIEGEDDGQPRAPWHFKLLMVALVIYLGYRFVQGVQWVMTHHH